MIPLAGDVGAYEVEVEQRFPKCFQVPFFFLSEGSHQQRIFFFYVRNWQQLAIKLTLDDALLLPLPVCSGLAHMVPR